MNCLQTEIVTNLSMKLQFSTYTITETKLYQVHGDFLKFLNYKSYNA